LAVSLRYLRRRGGQHKKTGQSGSAHPVHLPSGDSKDRPHERRRGEGWAPPEANPTMNLRTLVSQNKKRYQMHSFDLDLTYITDKVVAMVCPPFASFSLLILSLSLFFAYLVIFN
jgi:hypothetical protein